MRDLLPTPESQNNNDADCACIEEEARRRLLQEEGDKIRVQAQARAATETELSKTSSKRVRKRTKGVHLCFYSRDSPFIMPPIFVPQNDPGLHRLRSVPSSRSPHSLRLLLATVSRRR